MVRDVSTAVVFWNENIKLETKPKHQSCHHLCCVYLLGGQLNKYFFCVSIIISHCQTRVSRVRTQVGVIHVRSRRRLGQLDQLMIILSLLRVGTLRSLQTMLLDEALHLVGVHVIHHHPAAPRHQGHGSVLWEVGVGSDHVLPDTSCDQPPQLVDQDRVSAGVVQHHHCSVLNVVEPPLNRYKPRIN